MAATNLLHVLEPGNAYEVGGNAGAKVGVPVGRYSGVGFNAKTDSGVDWIFRLPATAGLSTGVTLNLLFADDPLNPDPGKVARFGVTCGEFAGTTYIPIDPTATGADVGTETTSDVDLPPDTNRPTLGKGRNVSVAITTANLGASVAAGDWVRLRLRRIGTHANDTHRGRVVFLGGDVRDT
jgi:hypothetical protein